MYCIITETKKNLKKLDKYEIKQLISNILSFIIKQETCVDVHMTCRKTIHMVRIEKNGKKKVCD